MTLDTNNSLLPVRLSSIRHAARDILIFEFQDLNGSPLPDSDPGAHIDINLPNGIVRQYSLINSGRGPRSYRVGVKRDPVSRGGSAYMHDQLKVGTTLQISHPRNHFPLAANATSSTFIAGGIGITPIYCMIHHLTKLGRPWRLIYACRSRLDAAFAEDLKPLKNVTLHLDDEQGGKLLDVAGVVKAAPAETHFYCCGPTPMLRTFEEATAGLPPEHVHAEYFSPAETPAIEGGYTVELARSKREFYIPTGSSILTVLMEAGVSVPHSCETGVCGSCETPVIYGKPDHRDSILNAQERAESKTMMVCCSGSLSDKLVLDL